jgi:hypothetical protein
VNNITETERAYLAGLIDGEGCLTISKTQGKNNRTPVYTAQIIIMMTNKEVIEYIKQVTGIGNIYGQNRQSPNQSAAYRWVVNTKSDLLPFLKSIKPFLIVKQNEIEILLEYLSLPPNPEMGKGKSMPAFYVNQRDQYYQRMRDLKTHGKSLTLDMPKQEFPVIESHQASLF